MKLRGKVYDSHSTRDNKHFCCWECFIAYKQKLSFYTLICEYCGKEYRVYKKKNTFSHGGNPRKYCSRECANRARIGKYIKDKSPNWLGGLTTLQDLIRKSIDYIRAREQCFKRDGYKSIISGKNGKLEHHHLIPISILIKEFNLTKDNWRNYKPILFNLNNLVTLTKSEHRCFHALYGHTTSPKEFEEFYSRMKAKKTKVK